MKSARTHTATRTKKIGASEYFELVLSNQRLERHDDESDDILGLYDPATGCRFIVDRKHLLEETIGGRRRN